MLPLVAWGNTNTAKMKKMEPVIKTKKNAGRPAKAVKKETRITIRFS